MSLTRTKLSHKKRCALLACTSALAAGALASPAAADFSYHSEHLNLTSIAAAPLRSGFVENIKAQGPQVYAHEIYMLNGALPLQDYTVSRNLFPFDPDCGGANGVFTSEVAELLTGPAGHAQGDAKVTPEEVAGFEGVHGVLWTVINSATGAIVYRTACTAVTLD